MLQFPAKEAVVLTPPAAFLAAPLTQGDAFGASDRLNKPFVTWLVSGVHRAFPGTPDMVEQD